VERVDWPNPGRPGRWAKVNLDKWSPFDQALYLDADTRIHGDLSAGFDALENGFDIAIVPSKWQGRPLHHLMEDERAVTLAELGDSRPLMYNSGVIYWRRSERTARLFDVWAEEWRRWEQHDQGALMRALERSPVRVWVLGSAFNGGGVVEHLFGRAKQ
jgi:lipopolysaccharide biosynthesis glycosyltransferase